MRLEDILKGVRHSSTGPAAGVDIRAVTDDSRAASRGCLFIARKGPAHDGSGFIAEAARKGAAAVLSDGRYGVPKGTVKIEVDDAVEALGAVAANFYGHPSDRLRTAGITGTNGKTTISYLIESAVKAAGCKAGVIGTISYRFAGREVPAHNTTPGAIALQAMMAGMVKGGARYAAIELSSHSLDQRRVSGVLLDAAVLTNVTGDHLDYHGTMARYFAAKRRIFGLLKPHGTAIINRDDARTASLEKALRRSMARSGRKALTYGHGADFRASAVKASAAGMSFVVKAPGRRFGIRTALLGAHNVSNILAAAAAASALGLDDRAIAKGVEAVTAVPGRLEPVGSSRPFRVFVDFAHTEDALINVLDLARGIAGRRLITVFGCGGDRDRTKRPRMGRAACRLSDRVFITSDNPRTEDAARIFGDIETGIRKDFSNYEIIEDRRRAIEAALGCARPGDIVIIAGKGHETCQIIGDKKMPFDDRKVAAGILKGMHEGKGYS
jgi:UDP-N-acetylmuramoyl-L-alanyl-D-glutamate--2,6-diaminopimelate ligase